MPPRRPSPRAPSCGHCRVIFFIPFLRASAARVWIPTLSKRCARLIAEVFLARAVAYDNRQKEIPASFIHSLRWHPVRLLSFLESPYYYGAKKRYLDWIASRQLATGRYDLFHSWSGDCLQSLTRHAQARHSIDHRNPHLASRSRQDSA